MVLSVGRLIASRPLLALLLAIDFIFVVIHVWLWSQGKPLGQFDVELDRSIPEHFQYLKWLICGLSCAYAGGRRRELLYFAWMALFVYFLVDDFGSIHEIGGWEITTAFGFTPAFALRAVDFGELAASFIAGVILLGAIALFYWGSADDEARALTRQLLPWLALLIASGIGLDMLHIQVMESLESPLAIMLCGVLEDAGEMAAASGLTATIVNATWPLARRSVA
jgi:hypothetical protein